MKYQNLEHTADLKIRAFGKDKEELFANMALGMFENIVDSKDIEKDQPVKRKIKVKSGDLPSLLVDFLSELVTLSDINNEVYLNYELRIMSREAGASGGNYELVGIATGYKVKRLKLEIKAVTYNDLKIEEKNGKWIAEVVFDI